MSGAPFDMRPCRPEESELWTQFLNENFGYKPPQSFSVDFAPLFESEALDRSRLIWRDGKIVSSATLYPVTAITQSRRLRLGVVGAVATSEDCRGQGLSSQVLEDLEATARAQGLEGIVLWSDQQEFYAKSGYSQVGQQQIYMLEELPAPSALATGTAVYGWDWAQVRALYERHAMRVERGDGYWKALERVKSCTRVQWVDNDGRVRAYLAFDRGKDLHGIIHEWGGEATALHSLLWTVLQNRSELFWLTHPRLSDPIRAMLLQPPLLAGHLGLFKSLGALTGKDLEAAWFWGLDSL